ncbi:MAG: hypothetical protein LLG04_02730 [Parachlamydia sp.]|nr:hypothetical protein [Parachlamydia sp.]
MNPVFLKNNAGLSFIYQGDRSIHVKDKFGFDLGEASHIYLNDLTSQEMECIESSEGEGRERLVTQFLHDRFATLGKQDRTFEVQCYIHQNRPFIVFEPYGLQAGGFKKLAALATGAGKIAYGIILAGGSAVATVATGGAAAAPTLPAALTGAGLLASGFGDMAYAFRTPEENMSLGNFAAQSAIGFAAGAAGGAAGVGVTAVAGQSLHVLATTALSGAASTAASTTASTVTEAAIKGDAKVLKRLTVKKLATSAAVGVLTGGVSSLTKAGVESGSQYLLNSSTRAVSDLAAKTAVGAAAGAASGSAVKITENFINQRTFLQVTYGSKPDDHVIEPGKLYVYIHEHKIHFQSIDEKGRGKITVIKSQDNFLVPFERETQIEKIIDVLNSKGRREFNDKQKKFILESAAKHHHVPLKLLNGVADAAAVGASSGAVIGLTKAAADRVKITASQVKKEVAKEVVKVKTPSIKRNPSKTSHITVFKRARLESQTASQKVSKSTEGHFLRRKTTTEVKKTENHEAERAPIAAAATERKTSLLVGKRIRVEESRTTEGNFLRRRTTHEVKKTEIHDAERIHTVATEKKPSLLFGKRVRVEQKEDSTKVSSVATEKLADRSCLKRRVCEAKPSEPDAKKPKEAVARLASKTEQKNPISLLGKRAKDENQTATPGESALQSKKIDQRFSPILKNFRFKAKNKTPSENGKKPYGEPDKSNSGTKAKQAPEQPAKKQVLESQKKEAGCVVNQATPEQVAAAQKSVDKANQQHANLVTLSTYSPLDFENKATEIYNGAKNQGLYGADAIKYIEKTLSDQYGIPMGTLTDSLKAAFISKPDKYVPTPIMNALLQRNNGNAISNAKQDVNNATQILNNLKEPACASPGLTQTQPPVAPPSFNILSLVTDSENVARNTGYENNINVQMRYLTTQLVGTDHGDQYDKVYTAYLDASFKWDAYHGNDKPTQYGFLSSITDLIVNGTTTVPVEVKTKPWYQTALGYVGASGVGFQLNGSGLQVGTMNHPNLATVYSTEKPSGIEGFQLPVSSSPNPSAPSTIIPTSFTPTAVQEPLPIQKVNSAPTPSKPVSVQPSAPVPTHAQPSGVTGGDTNKLPTHLEINPNVYIAADSVQPLLRQLNTVPGLDGLGSYASGAVEKVAITLSTLERIDDPLFQNQPIAQRIGCALWGSTVELVGVSPSAPIGLVHPVLGAEVAAVLSPLASEAGDNAQQNCHDVINMFKPTS